MEMAEGKGRGYKYRMVGLNRGDFWPGSVVFHRLVGAGVVESAVRSTNFTPRHGRLVACESDASAFVLSILRLCSQQEIEDSLCIQASHKSLRERVDFLEKLLGESADKHSEAPQARIIRKVSHAFFDVHAVV